MLSYTALVFDPSPASTLGRRNPATTTASHLQPPCNSPFLLCREDPKVLLALEMFRVFTIPSPLLPNPQRELKSSLIFNSAFFFLSFLCFDWDGIPVPTLLLLLLHPSPCKLGAQMLRAQVSSSKSQSWPGATSCSSLQRPKLCDGPFSAPVPSWHCLKVATALLFT